MLTFLTIYLTVSVLASLATGAFIKAGKGN